MKKVLFIFLFLPVLAISQIQTVKICTLSPVQADFISGKNYDRASFFLVQKTDKGVSFITKVEVLETDTNLFRNLSFLKFLPVQTYTFIPEDKAPY